MVLIPNIIRANVVIIPWTDKAKWGMTNLQKLFYFRSYLYGGIARHSFNQVELLYLKPDVLVDGSYHLCCDQGEDGYAGVH